MELLQTIWTALTTPNEGLIILLSIPLAFLDAFIGMLVFTTILNIESTNKQKLIYIIVYGLIGNIVNFLIPNSYTIFIIMIIWPITIHFAFKTNFLKSILAEIIAFSFSSILDFVIVNIFLTLFNVSSESLYTIPLYRVAIMLSIYFTVFMTTLAIKYFKLNIKVFDNMHRKTKILLTTNLLLMILVIGMQFYLVRYYSDTMPTFITCISLLSIIAYFAITIYSIINSSKLAIAARDLKGANLEIHTLHVLHDTVRTFKHDFDNIVNGIGGYVRNKDIEGLTKYYEQLQQDCNKTNNLYSLSPTVINHPAIYNILATKYYISDELNIPINLDIFLDLNEIEKYMKIYEFTRILGILLDNSIEAAKECDDKLINVIFRKEENKHRIVVIIENTYLDKEINIDEIFKKGFSSKTNQGNSGLGLWEIRQILKRNNNLNLFTSKTKDLFKQQFEIYY